MSESSEDSVQPLISADGRFITFRSSASNLVSGDTNGRDDVFVVLNPLFSEYDPNINRLAREVNANGAERIYTYDRIGNITSITDRDGTTQRYTYDKLNRRTKEEWLDFTGTVTRTITNTYNAAGELTQISDPDSTYSYTYDLDGRMLTVSNEGTPSVPTTIMTYAYDNVGNDLTMSESINDTTGVVTSHQFDALNRLTVNTQGNSRIDYSYNALSQVTNKKRYSDPTGTNLVAETNHTYDQLNRLIDIVHSNGANNISSYTQTYDEGSKITGITSTDGVSTYTYDDTDQLVGADYNFQTDENYTYDDNGNRTNTGYVTGINNRLLEDSKYRYEYDKVGNRTKRTNKTTNEVTEYTWDVRDRLIGFKLKNASGTIIKSAQYIYDVYDQRIAKIVDLDGVGALPAVTERFVYGTNQNIALVFDGNGTLTHRYLFGNGIDQIEADEQVDTGTTLWALPDHLGSVRDVVDNSGTVQNHIVYDAFGNITSQSNSSVVFKFGYTGRELDSESGLQYNRGRYYDPTVGRFISEDPISFGGGDANLSRYVQNNSLSFVDPLGKNPINRILQRQNSIPPSGNILAIYDTRKSNLTLSDRETGKSLEVASFSGGGSRQVPGSNPPRYETVDKTYINDLSRANIEDLGTIPKGRYEIFRINDKPAYGYRLEAIDSIPRDDIDQNTIDPKSKRQRSQYRLHAFGNSSGGCITVKNLAKPDESEDSRRKRGDEVRKFIERTSKPYDDKSPISLWQRLLYGSKIYKYGELIVK